MITKEQCADWINANIENELTAEEIEKFRDSIKGFPAKKPLCEALIGVFGDVSLLVELRDAD